MPRYSTYSNKRCDLSWGVIYKTTDTGERQEKSSCFAPRRPVHINPICRLHQMRKPSGLHNIPGQSDTAMARVYIVMRLRLGRRFVNLSPLAQRAKTLTNGSTAGPEPAREITMGFEFIPTEFHSTRCFGSHALGWCGIHRVRAEMHPSFLGGGWRIGPSADIDERAPEQPIFPRK